MDNVSIFNEVECSKLDKRKVFKYGVKSDKIVGIVCKINLCILKENLYMEVFLIELYFENDKDLMFLKFGDSGVVVLIKFGLCFIVFFMIFGGDVNIDGVVKNCFIVVEFKDVII